MPFVSQDQRGWMYANKPEMAKRWEKHTPKGKKLPKKVDKKAFLKGFCQKCAAYKIDPVVLMEKSGNEALGPALAMGGLGAALGGGLTALSKLTGPSQPELVAFDDDKHSEAYYVDKPTTWGDVAINALLSGALSGGVTYALNR